METVNKFSFPNPITNTHIIRGFVEDLITGKKYTLQVKMNSMKKTSKCLFFEDIILESGTRLVFRLDYTDISQLSDPTLELNVFAPFGAEITQVKTTHHTTKTFGKEGWCYTFDNFVKDNKSGIRLKMVFKPELAHQTTIQARARIKKS